MQVVKRDGTIVDYNLIKIQNAIFKAFEACDMDSAAPSKICAEYVNTKLIHENKEYVPVEHIQDVVEDALIANGYIAVAKEYIKYREARTKARTSKLKLNNVIDDLVNIDAANSDEKRENANINADTMCGSLFKVGGAVMKDYFFNHISPKYAKMHFDGKIHIHDGDLAMFAVNCLMIPAGRLLRTGFSTGHGYLRTPKSIGSASTLIAIIIQSSQNDYFGGQAIPTLDYDLAPFVAKSYIRNIARYIEIKYEDVFEPIDGMTMAMFSKFDLTAYLKEKLIEPIDAYIDIHEHIMDDEGKTKIEDTLLNTLPFTNDPRYLNHENMFDYAYRKTERETYQAMEALIHNLCTLASRSGGQVPFSSCNFGTDISEEGRMVSKNFMNAIDAGLGAGETAIFPIAIFKILKGVTTKGCKNYDLYQQSIRVSAKRGFPNWVNVSAPMNIQYYKKGHPETEVATMGCRTRVIDNLYDPKHRQVTGRGNLFFTTISLPYLALEVKENNPDATTEELYAAFNKALDTRVDDCIAFSKERFKLACRRKAKNFPFAMGQHLYIGSENLTPDDSIEQAIKEGSQSVGFCGLAECLVALFGKHHGESKESQEKGLAIVKRMHDRIADYAKKENVNYSLFATPAEGCAGRLLRACRKRFGIIKGVTDREYITNSCHVPVYYKISAYDKIKIEAPYHPLCSAGVISYIELDYDATKNTDAMEKLVDAMADSGMTYFSINHPIDHDPVCGYVGHIPLGGVCPRCGRHEGEGVPAGKLLELHTYRPTPEYAVDKDMLEDNDTTTNDI